MSGENPRDRHPSSESFTPIDPDRLIDGDPDVSDPDLPADALWLIEMHWFEPFSSASAKPCTVRRWRAPHLHTDLVCTRTSILPNHWVAPRPAVPPTRSQEGQP